MFTVLKGEKIRPFSDHMIINVKKITEKKSHKKAEYKKIYRNYCLSLITEKPKYSVKNKPSKLLFSSSFSFSLNI